MNVVDATPPRGRTQHSGQQEHSKPQAANNSLYSLYEESLSFALNARTHTGDCQQEPRLIGAKRNGEQSITVYQQVGATRDLNRDDQDSSSSLLVSPIKELDNTSAAEDGLDRQLHQIETQVKDNLMKTSPPHQQSQLLIAPSSLMQSINQDD